MVRLGILMPPKPFPPLKSKWGINVSIVNCWGTTLCFPVHTIRFLQGEKMTVI